MKRYEELTIVDDFIFGMYCFSEKGTLLASEYSTIRLVAYLHKK